MFNHISLSSPVKLWYDGSKEVFFMGIFSGLSSDVRAALISSVITFTGVIINILLLLLKDRFNRSHAVFNELRDHRIEAHKNIHRVVTKALTDIETGLVEDCKGTAEAILSLTIDKVLPEVAANGLWADELVIARAYILTEAVSKLIKIKRGPVTPDNKKEIEVKFGNIYLALAEACRKKSGVYFLNKKMKKITKQTKEIDKEVEKMLAELEAAKKYKN
jgi:hypothetical protein